MCGARALCGITAAVGNNTDAPELCKLVASCKRRNGLELTIPHYRSPFHILSKEGEIFLSLSTPTFLPLTPHPEASH